MKDQEFLFESDSKNGTQPTIRMGAVIQMLSKNKARIFLAVGIQEDGQVVDIDEVNVWWKSVCKFVPKNCSVNVMGYGEPKGYTVPAGKPIPKLFQPNKYYKRPS